MGFVLFLTVGVFIQGASALSPGCSDILSAVNVMVPWAAWVGSPLLQLLALAVLLSLLVFAAVQI